MKDELTPEALFWRGITTGRLRDVERGLSEGYTYKGAPAGLHYKGDSSSKYQPRPLKEGTLPLEALFICLDSWSYNSTNLAEYRKLCTRIVKETPRSFFQQPLQNGYTALLTYCKLPGNMQKSNVFTMILKRTPKELIDLPDEKGNTALFCLINRYRLQSVNALIEAGADVNARNHQGRNSALVAAALYKSSNRSLATPQSFLGAVKQAGARIDLPDNDGNTLPFFDESAPLQPFIEAGGNINAHNTAGKTLAQRALDHGNLKRLLDLLDCEQTNWKEQIPDMQQFVNKLSKHNYSNSVDQNNVKRLQVHLEAFALADATPISTSLKRSARL